LEVVLKYIEEKIQVFATPEKIFDHWTQKFLKLGLEVGKVGYVAQGLKKGLKFKILEVKKDEIFTLMWHSFFFKLIYMHKIEKIDHGSLVTCQVTIKSPISFLIMPFISKNIRNDLQTSLKQFSKNINL
jgi:hypothetical protein